jgi:hypothetical protein
MNYIDALNGKSGVPSKDVSAAAYHQAYQTILDLGKKNIDYSLYDPTNALNKLLDTINSQKNTLLR